MESIKNDIRVYLTKADEANVKQIAKATGHSETEVINALNAMRVYAEVECAQGGRGKGMTYWLAKAETQDVNGPEEKPVAQAPVKKNPAPASGQDSGAFGKVQDATKALREENAALKSEVEDYERIVSVMRSTLGIKDGESIKLAIEKLKSERDAYCQAEIRWERTMMELVGEDGIGSVKNAIEKLQADLGNARIQIGTLNEQLIHDDSAIDVKDAAKGYLVCAPKRKPAKLMKPENAVARAHSMARVTGRSEVFALVPVGTAIQKKVKTVEYKEAKAA